VYGSRNLRLEQARNFLLPDLDPRYVPVDAHAELAEAESPEDLLAGLYPPQFFGVDRSPVRKTRG